MPTHTLRDHDLTTIQAAVKKLWPELQAVLAGRPAKEQGAILADLTAIWIAGHVERGNPAGTQRLRNQLVLHQLDYIDQLVPINAKLLRTDE
jgi:N-dimethylarginine dimethylaminohydrolase